VPALVVVGHSLGSSRSSAADGPGGGSIPPRASPGCSDGLVDAADDEIFEPDWERFMARNLLGIEPIEIPGGHFPMAEDPRR
jgi:hypothetical protein